MPGDLLNYFRGFPMPLARDTKTLDTRVARMMARRVVLLVAEMIGHFGR